MAKHKRSGTAAEALEPHAKQSLRLWLRLLATTTIIEKAIRAHLKANCDSTLPRFDVLAAMDRTEGRMTMSQLSSHLLVSNGNVTGVINRLVEDGFVRRQVDEFDRRTQFVSLTAAGRQSFRRMAEQHEGLVDDIFSEVSDDDMAQLLSLTTKVSRLVQRKLKSSLIEAPHEDW